MLINFFFGLKKAGVPVAFTLSDAFVVNTFRGLLEDFIRWHVDILFCNDVEAKAMFETDDTESAFEQLSGMVDTLFLTRGKEGAWATDGTNGKVTVGSFPVKAVDTTGAGDLFAAGTLHGLCQGHSIKESAILGSYCAAQVVSHMGGRIPTNALTDVAALLKEYKGP